MAKITRICAKLSAFPVGEMDAIHGGNEGTASASTGASRTAFGPGAAHEAIATATMAAQLSPKARNDNLLTRQQLEALPS
ncbi:MAG: hypothetical protein WB757_07570 [Candidatus Cybelea sp.]